MNKKIKIIIWLVLALTLIYFAGRVYYQVTDGFAVSEITSLKPYNPNLGIKPLSLEEEKEVKSILSQPFHYLGKGCQSYVFLSEDGQYVIKFLKYKHFTPQKWLHFLSFIPTVHEYQQNKIEIKQKNLNTILTSWKIAYEELKPETALVYVHLNKSNNLNQQIVITDKIGIQSVLNADDYEFLIQKRTNPFKEVIEKAMKKGHPEIAKELIDRLFTMIVSEYNRGLGDNDHALMQNTGVLAGMPIHIDVGQFVKNESFKELELQQQEVFNKTYRFRAWLKNNYPELKKYLDEKLFAYIGSKMNELNPILKSLSCDE